MPIDYSDKTLYPYGQGGIRNPDPGTITSSTLAPTGNLSLEVSTPTYPATTPIQVPQLQATQGEQQQSDIMKQLQGINLSLTGAPEYQQQQEQQFGIQQKTQAVQDFYNQLLQIQGEQAALKAREAQIAPGLDLRLSQGQSAYTTEFTRGRQEEKARRELAIEGLAVSARAATTAALFQAAQGNLATAQSMVEKAVRDKFATQEAQQKALLANLQLIQNDPATTRQEKNRALALEQSLGAQQEQRSFSKQNYQSNLELANDLIKNGFTDAVTLQKIQEAKDANGNYSLAEAQRIAAESGATSVLQKQEKATQTQSIGTQLQDPSVQYYTQLLAEGKITVANVPQGIRNAVVAASEGVINTRLSDAAITQITQTEKALSDLGGLRSAIQNNLQFIGPISGLAALNPWSRARQVQADINRVKQTVGKALEGGVLRKEDEEKYKKILATLTDTPETALYKIDALTSSIQRDIENYKKLQAQTGRFVPGGTKTFSPQDLRSKYNY